MIYRAQDNPFARELVTQRAAIDAERAADDAAWEAAFAEAEATWNLYREAIRVASGCDVDVVLRKEDHADARHLRDARTEVVGVVLVCGSARRRLHSLVWTRARGWQTRRGHEQGHGRLEDALLAVSSGLAADIDEVRR